MKIRNINIENDELVVIKIEGDSVLKCLRKDDDNKLYVCNILTPTHSMELVNEILLTKDK